MTEQQFPVAEAIRTRRTIKKFKQEPVPMALIQELLDVAVWAPNHKMREPWRFMAFVDEGKEQLVTFLQEDKSRGRHAQPMKPAKVEHLLTTPVFVAVVMPVDPRPAIFEEDLAAVSALIQNFQLAAWERGVGVLWNTMSSIYSPELHGQIGVERGEKLVALLQIGYPDAIPKERERTAVEERFTVISKAADLPQQ